MEKYVRTDNMIDRPFPAFGPRAADDAMRGDVARDGAHPGPLSNREFGLATARFVLERGLVARAAR